MTAPVLAFSLSSGFPIDAEVEVFMHKNRKMTYKIKIYTSMWSTILCTYFLVLSDRSAVSTSSWRKRKRSSTGIKVFCVVSLDMSMRIAITPFSLFPEHRENVAPHLAIKRTQNKNWSWHNIICFRSCFICIACGLTTSMSESNIVHWTLFAIQVRVLHATQSRTCILL